MCGVGCVSNAQQGYVWMSHLYTGSISFIHKLACRHALHVYMLYVCTDLTSPTCASSLMRSSLAEPTTCTTSEHSVQENFHPSDMFHPCTHALCLCTYHTSVNRKQRGEEKMMLVILTIAKGQLGLILDLEMTFQWSRCQMLKVTAEDCLMFLLKM